MFKVLIIEDDELYAQNLAREFPEDQYLVELSHDGEEGLQKALEIQPDLVILDLMLPKMLGVTFMEHLRQDERTQKTPVLAITNFGGQANKERALNVGINEFMVKVEVTTKELGEVGKKYLSK